MRTVHVIEPEKNPDPVNVVGEAITSGSIHAYKNISATARMIGVVSDSRGGQFFAAVDQL